MGIELFKAEGCFPVLVIVDNKCLRIAKRSCFPLTGGAADLPGRDAAELFFEDIFFQGVPVSKDDSCNTGEHVGRKGVCFTFPSANNHAKCLIQNVIPIFVIDSFNSRDRANTSGCASRSDGEVVRFDQVFYDKVLEHYYISYY